MRAVLPPDAAFASGKVDHGMTRLLQHVIHRLDAHVAKKRCQLLCVERTGSVLAESWENGHAKGLSIVQKKPGEPLRSLLALLATQIQRVVEHRLCATA